MSVVERSENTDAVAAKKWIPRSEKGCGTKLDAAERSAKPDAEARSENGCCGAKKQMRRYQK